MNVTNIWESSGDLRVVVGLSIIHQHNLKIGVIDFAERL
jgi:hypothetical protein